MEGVALSKIYGIFGTCVSAKHPGRCHTKLLEAESEAVLTPLQKWRSIFEIFDVKP